MRNEYLLKFQFRARKRGKGEVVEDVEGEGCRG
jgi:hypothetical protein